LKEVAIYVLHIMGKPGLGTARRTGGRQSTKETQKKGKEKVQGGKGA